MHNQVLAVLLLVLLFSKPHDSLVFLLFGQCLFSFALIAQVDFEASCSKHKTCARPLSNGEGVVERKCGDND